MSVLSGPNDRAEPSAVYPCRCLCFGLRLQITRTTPRRLMILQCSQIRFTLERTFMTQSVLLIVRETAFKDNGCLLSNQRFLT